jgi:hypothetical protein
MPFKAKLLKIIRYFSNFDLYLNGISSSFRLSNLKDDPIIVCGAPRSGTTLMISVLGSHDDIIAIPYETWLFVNKRPQRWFKRDDLNRKFSLFLLHAIMISLKIKKHHKRWCEKTPDNVLHLGYIFDLFKRKIKVIHIIRDGRDVVLSHHSKLGTFMTPQKWTRYVTEGLKFKEDPNVLTIHYENLILDFDHTMRSVSEFLNIPNTFRREFFLETNVSDNASVISGYGNKGLYVARPLSSDSLNKWKSNQDVINQFKSYPPALDLLEKLGYEQQ